MKHPILLLALTAAGAHAAVTYNLPGTMETAGWDQLNRTDTSFWDDNGFPTAGPAAWPGAVAANAAGSTSSAVLSKLSGGAYFAGASIYNAGMPDVLTLGDTSPQAGLSSIIFQADLGSALAGVSLSYNGGSQALAADFTGTSAGSHLSGFGGPPEPTTNFIYQWDVRGLGVSEYEITFSTVPHGTIFELNLATGEGFAQVVPEPSAALLGGAAGLLLLARRRRSRANAIAE